MTGLLLRVGSPTVTYSGLSDCWLVDCGALVPIAVPGRRRAFEVAASYNVPAGSDMSTRASSQPGASRPLTVEPAVAEDAVTPSAPTAAPSPACGGRVPEPTVASPGNDGSGAFFVAVPARSAEAAEVQS